LLPFGREPLALRRRSLESVRAERRDEQEASHVQERLRVDDEPRDECVAVPDDGREIAEERDGPTEPGDAAERVMNLFSVIYSDCYQFAPDRCRSADFKPPTLTNF
jgi:hypothetical protein